MAAAQTGDEAAYRSLLQQIVPIVRAIGRRRISDVTLLEDVIQDTLLALHTVRHTFDPDLPFLPWLYTITNARAVDALRARGRRDRRETSDPAALENYPATAATDSAHATAVVAEVRYRLESLPARQRRAVEMVKLQEMSLGEAASLSNQSVSSLKSLLHRAMNNLRSHRDTSDE